MGARQVGYDNDDRHWIAQNSYGSRFADGGLFRIAYGIADVANPNETYAITCTPAASGVTPAAGRLWPLQRQAAASDTQSACYVYRARSGDYLAGVAEHFGIPLLRLINQNLPLGVFETAADGTPDLTTSLTGKDLLLCGITADLAWTAQLGEFY